MPGNVSNAAPTLVLPQTLCTAFSEGREYAVLQNTYHDGAYQIGQLAQTSRRTFRLSRRLPPAAVAALYAFYVSVEGGLTPFYFYNPYDAMPVGSNYDPAGVRTTGRYTVVFRGDWAQQTDLARSNVSIQLEEVL